MKKLFLTFLICSFAFIGGQAFAQSVQGIAAVVNDNVISNYDLNARLSLIMAGSRTPDTQENRQRLAPEVLRRMIDETLKMQEAKRLNIKVSDADIQQALNRLESQNNMPPGGLDRFLKQAGIDKATLIAEVEPQIAWVKVVNHQVRPQIQVTPEEIDEAMARLRASKGKPEYLLSEIFLRVDETENEPRVHQLATRILQQLKQGADFAALARNFSQAASANDGGNLGWVRADELGDNLETPVAGAKPGQVIGPIRTLDGFNIILLRNSRIAQGLPATTQEVKLQQLFFPVAKGNSVQQVMNQASTTAAGAKSCSDMENLAQKLATPMSGSLGTLKMDSLPGPLQEAIRNLEIGQPSKPIHTDKGVIVLMVCGRTGQDAEQGQRERIGQMLAMQRLDAAARRYLRDLRRTAFIDIRL